MILRVEGLVMGYGARTVLHGVDLELARGEILGLLGPNGAGKSTLLRRMAGVLPSRAGAVLLDGADPASDLSARARIGYMPEAPALYADDTVLRYVMYLADLSGVRRRDRRQAALDALERTGAGKLAHRLCGRLSKGQRQRVAMAAAIAHQPDVILLDEPGEGLDPRQTVALRKLLRELAGGAGIVFSTHLLSEAQATCDRVVILDQGRLVADRPTEPSIGSRLRVSVTGADDEALALAILAVPGVTEVHHGICTVDGPEVGDAIAAAIRERGWKLMELARLPDDLEVAFLDAVREEAT